MDALMAIFGAVLVLLGLLAQPGDGYTWQPVAAVIIGGAVFVVVGVVLWWRRDA